MKNITEKFNEKMSISQMIEHKDMENSLNESLKDIFNVVKNKFKQVWRWLKGLVVINGFYVVPVNDEGEVQPAITPMTAGVAYKDGYIKDDFTFVYNSKDASKISGLRNKPEDALKLYGADNKAQTFAYWGELFESAGNQQANVNEVKLHTEDPEAKYNIIEDDEELRDEIIRHIKKGNLARMLIWGAPGIGKTAILKDVVKAFQSAGNDYQLIVKTLSNETPDNFFLPEYVDVAGEKRSADIPKTWLPVYKPTGDPKVDAANDEACGKGMLFVDELSRATQQVLNVMLPLLQEGQLNGWHMGSGWTIVCASNRLQDELESGSQSQLGKALTSRFAQVYYEPTVHTWRKWAEQQKYISPLLLQWLSLPSTETHSGQKYYYMDPNEDYQDGGATTIICNPREWDNAMRELATFSHTGDLQGFTIFDIDRKIIGRVVNKYIPSSAVDSFLAFLEVIHKVGDFDRVTYDIWKNGGKNVKISKKDLGLVCLPLSQLIITSHADKLPTQEEFDNLMTWIVDQDYDQLASYVLDIFKNVFMGDIKDATTRNKLFVLKAVKKHLESQPDKEEKMRIYDAIFKPFFSRWNVDWESMPDYGTGVAIANKKYGETFRTSKVDGLDALG